MSDATVVIFIRSIFEHDSWMPCVFTPCLGEITLIATGPLTNLATALKLDPDFGHNLRDCVVMGGNTTGKKI